MTNMPGLWHMTDTVMEICLVCDTAGKCVLVSNGLINFKVFFCKRKALCHLLTLLCLNSCLENFVDKGFAKKIVTCCQHKC